MYKGGYIVLGSWEWPDRHITDVKDTFKIIGSSIRNPKCYRVYIGNKSYSGDCIMIDLTWINININTNERLLFISGLEYRNAYAGTVYLYNMKNLNRFFDVIKCTWGNEGVELIWDKDVYERFFA